MNGCISLNLRIEYIEVHDLKGKKKNSRTDIVGYRYNPNLSSIEIFLIYSNTLFSCLSSFYLKVYFAEGSKQYNYCFGYLSA